MANDISWGEATSTSFVVYAENLRTSYGEKEIYWYLDGNLEYNYTLTEDAESDEVQFRNLDADTEYSVYYQIIYVDGSRYDEYSDTIYPTTEVENVTEWTAEEPDNWGYVTDITASTYYINEYSIVIIKFRFENSGTATFYSKGASSSRGYLSDSTSFDAENGRPSSRLEYDRNSSGDFEFTYDVKADTYYYLFVGNRYEDESGEISVYIKPPDSSSDYPPPTTGDTELTCLIDGNSAIVTINNFNSEYDLNDVILTKWTVTCITTGEVIFDAIEKRSDKDDSYDYISFDVTENYQYQVYVEVHGYPDFINADVDVWTDTIYITAEDTGDSGWKVYHIKDYSNISEVKSLDLSLGQSHVNLISVTFKSNGTATFYSRGDIDVRGYLSLTDEFDTAQGFPYDYIADNDDIGNGDSNFSFTYDVVSGTTYYFWVRCFNDTGYGTTTIYIEPPILSTLRPDYFIWTKREPGKPFDLTASIWRDLLNNINEVRVYKGYNKVPEDNNNYIFSTNYYNYFTYPNSGDIFRYQHYNQALNGIIGVLGYGYSDNAVKQGQTVTADCLNFLVELLNGIE